MHRCEFDRFHPTLGGRAATVGLSPCSPSKPGELAARYRLVFEEDADDLDTYQLAAIELADASQVWLMRHRGNPTPGTVVYADAHADAERTRRLLADAFGLRKGDFRWVAPPAEVAAMRGD